MVWLSSLAASCVVVAIVLGITAAQQAWFGQRVDRLLTGFLLGAGLVSVPWAVWALALSTDGSATWRIGADAEGWTASELHELGGAWHIEHNVPFPENGYVRDVDHVAVGPFGVLAVETKWTSAAVDLGSKRLVKEVQDAMRQAEDNAGRVRGLLRRVAEVEVVPVVVFWGREVKAPAKPVRREGNVRIVAGQQAALWRKHLNAERLDPETVTQLSERVHGWLVEQEQKLIGAGLQRRLKQAQRVRRMSMAATAVIAVLFPAAEASADLDRLVGRVFGLGGGAVGVTIFFFPVMLALLALALVHLARRVDPTISWSQGLVPLILWCAGFGLLWLATP